MHTPVKVDTHARYIEVDTERKIRHRNKLYYRFNHWPIWIFVFFIAPGPLTFDLFERGFDARTVAWLGMVLLGTGSRALRTAAGCEPPLLIGSPGRLNPLIAHLLYNRWASVAFAG